jgi:hypothetical protein
MTVAQRPVQVPREVSEYTETVSGKTMSAHTGVGR